VVPEKQGLKPSVWLNAVVRILSLSSGSRKTRIETTDGENGDTVSKSLSSGSRKTRIETQVFPSTL